MWKTKIIIFGLIIIYGIFLNIGIFVSTAEKPDIEPNELTIDTSHIDLTPIHKRPIPFPGEDTTLAIITFTYADSNETRSVELIVNDLSELEIKYENCTPLEGARIAYWLMFDRDK